MKGIVKVKEGKILPTDQELIVEIKNGSQAAMEVLVKRYYKNIFAYIYRKVGDYHLSYDLTQEVFIKMMKSIDTYKAQGKFENWLLTIAVNHCRDYFRSSKYKHKNEETDLKYWIDDEKANVTDLLSQKVESEQVRMALQKLPEYQRETIVLRYYHDLKIKEIALITNSKEATVKSRLRQGIKKLKVFFKGVRKNDAQGQ